MMISNRMPKVLIEYDKHGKRVQRVFDNPVKARQFYIVKVKANKNPKVKGK